jgi:hypothetical protein
LGTQLAKFLKDEAVARELNPGSMRTLPHEGVCVNTQAERDQFDSMAGTFIACVYASWPKMGHVGTDIPARLKKMGVLEARIPPVAVGGRLRLSFALGALFTALLPFMYVALIAVVAWALYSFVSDPRWNVRSPLALASVLTAGCLLILSLLKPLVASPTATSEPHYLDSEEQPLLFGLVRALASNIGVTRPERIAVDCNVNCYCMFAGGIRGLFGSGFALVIGLPLVAGLGLDQIVGVLAHELGHALQITAMRSNRVIWVVDSWLSRVATQEDEFDLRLQGRLDAAGYMTRPALRLAQLLVGVGSGILWLLWIMEGTVTSGFRRRIEIAADRYQIRASGSDRFVSSILKINLLALAAQRALIELSGMKREGRLIDDYPALIAYIGAHYPADFVQRIAAGLGEERTGMLRAHPRDKDRIALARTEDQQGIVTTDLPASALFAKYEALCREVTGEYYEQELGLAPIAYEIVPIETVLNE